MKKLIVIGLVVSLGLAACGHKKASTTPNPTPDTKGATTAPMGGASYGGAAYGTPAK